MIRPPLPVETTSRLLALQPAFTRPTWHRIALLVAAARYLALAGR